MLKISELNCLEVFVSNFQFRPVLISKKKKQKNFGLVFQYQLSASRLVA